ncbi:MAG: DnaJ domain-containing protein [Anaerolineae bacterium]|nr:DnaJ domain-containing protein [Anaerolineae bacterium]
MNEFEHDYYAILGIEPGAGEREIKQAYRHLARQYHPDVSTEADAVDRFHEVQEAYELLLDPMRREAYDHWRRQHGLDRPLPLILKAGPSQSRLPCLAEPQVLYVLVEILPSPDVESQRLPMNLCLVLDRSTSMKGARLQQVKEAARYIVDQLEAEDILSLVTFNDRAELVLPGRRSLDKGAARSAINSIQSCGGTEILHGLKLGWQQVMRWHNTDSVSHLLLLTDGQTYGDEAECLEMARMAAQHQVSLTLMGVGSDWNDALLDQMAQISGSPDASIYIDSTNKIVKTFQERIQRMGSTFAHDLTLTLHLGTDTKLKEAYRVSPQISQVYFADDRVSLGSLRRQDPLVLILELLVSGTAPGEHRLLQVDIEGIVPSFGPQAVRAHKAVMVSFDTTLDKRDPVPPDIISAMGKLTIFKMQERAMDDIEQGHIEPAVARLKTMATRLLDIGEVELARAALLEAGRLSQTGSLSASGRKKIRYGTRGLTIVPKEVRYD